jgi:hypothetical protein
MRAALQVQAFGKQTSGVPVNRDPQWRRDIE